MTLDFLVPARAGGPPARSPLADAAAAAGAAIETRDGWDVATSFGDPAGEAAACAETVGFADRSPLVKLELQGPAAAVEAALGRHDGEAAGDDRAAGLARRADGAWHCPLTPTKALLLTEPDGADAARRGLDDALRVCDLTGAWGALTVVGPRARDLFARFCALDLRDAALPVRGLRPGSVARTPGYVLREDVDRFLMLFGAAYGAYVWEVVADAAARLGGRPVGVDAPPASIPTASSPEHARA